MGSAQEALPQPEPLRGRKVPEPSKLGDFIRDKQAAIVLGEALFWNMQVSSDKMTSCASCHFHAQLAGSPTSAVTIHSSNTAKPVFTVRPGIASGISLAITCKCRISSSQPAITYTSQFTDENGGKMMFTGVFAPVTVGGALDGDPVFRDWDGDGGAEEKLVLIGLPGLRHGEGAEVIGSVPRLWEDSWAGSALRK